jgi:sporulation protein YlmC with PRC-barrel domain
MEVITADAFNLGKVDGAEIDTGTWQLTHLVVELTKEGGQELGFRKPLLGSISVCLPVTAVNKIGHVVTLSKSIPELKNLKECKAE